jgi:hypothetical protein
MQSEFNGKKRARVEVSFAARRSVHRFPDQGNGGPVTIR